MQTAKRGKNVAIFGAVLQSVFALVMLVLWLKSGSLSALSLACFLAGGAGVWLMAAVLFYCRQLERQEAAELEEIAAGERRTIFDRDQRADLSPAAARLAMMEKWVVPVFTLLWAALHVVVGVLLLRHVRAAPAPELVWTGQAALFSILIWFASRRQQWMICAAEAALLARFTAYLSG